MAKDLIAMVAPSDGNSIGVVETPGRPRREPPSKLRPDAQAPDSQKTPKPALASRGLSRGMRWNGNDIQPSIDHSGDPGERSAA
ncbi:MAG TPA: hypothetical protein VNO74_01970, partial [Methylomirabilota bacterium]|nr:hypothetical protein [Methylomirabilota bacterium]